MSECSCERIARNASIAGVLVAAAMVAGCGDSGSDFDISRQIGPNPLIPEAQNALLPSMSVAAVVGWQSGQMPSVGEGLRVTAYASDLAHPRTVHTLPNGDVLVVQSRGPTGKPVMRPKDVIRGWIMAYAQGSTGTEKESNLITLLRDVNRDGIVDERHDLLTNLNSPFGVAWYQNTLYVAATDALLAYPYPLGQTEITAPARVVTPLPGGPINHHWTKDLALSPDGRYLFVSVGSNSNIAERGMEAEKGRAAIWQVDRETGASKVFASGLRNPNGLQFHPETGALWAVINERDELGPNLVPDYLTSVKEGGFYGWPWSYWGRHVDARVHPQRPDMVEAAILPDYGLASHVAPLGMTFAANSALPEAYRNGAFIGEHGSWNRTNFIGYKVVFVPFANGVPAGAAQDVVTGFLDGDEARGRPVGLAIDGTGALLIADDAGNRVWRVAAADGSITPRPIGTDQVTVSTIGGAAALGPSGGDQGRQQDAGPGAAKAPRPAPSQTDIAPATLPRGTVEPAPATKGP